MTIWLFQLLLPKTHPKLALVSFLSPHLCTCVCWSLSRVLVFVTPWTIVCLVCLSMEFSRQEDWNGLLFLSPGYLPNPGGKSWSPTLKADLPESEPPWLSHLNFPWSEPLGKPLCSVVDRKTSSLAKHSVCENQQPCSHQRITLKIKGWKKIFRANWNHRESRSDYTYIYAVLSHSIVTFCDPMDYSLPGSSVNGDSPGKNTGMGFHALLQGIFPTQGSNPGLLHCRQILYCLR